MGWLNRASLILILAGLTAGCAGAGHQLPAISKAEIALAQSEILAAPNLIPTARTAAQNEGMARSAMRRLQAAANPVCANTDRKTCWYTLEFSPEGKIRAYTSKNEIVLFNGLAQYLETEDEFAAVLGHEMGHHISHHYEKGIQNRVAGEVITGIIFAGLATATNAYQYNPYQAQTDMQNAMKMGRYIGDISFSKEHEREADYISAYLMTRAGYDPNKAKSVWVKITKASGKMTADLFATHPSGPDRLAAWKQSTDEVRYSVDMIPNLVNAKEEPRLQQARVFGDPAGVPAGGESGVVLASQPYSSQGSGAAMSGPALGLTGSAGAGYSTGSSPDAAWVGSGITDTCGGNWIMKVEKQGSNLRGNMWWKSVKYDIYGKLDASGRAGDAHAGKSKESRSTPGPRLFKFNFVFSGDSATGRYANDSTSSTCQANFSLLRS